MEILHGLVGLVRSPVSATLPQIGSRLFLTWGILWSFPETQSHILVTSLVISCNVTHPVSCVGCTNATSSTSDPPLYAQPVEHFDAIFGTVNAFLKVAPPCPSPSSI
uniref:Very-long-chain (3R)-3-hydroxyacyl-CoA dehydratase n=1 Tax=Aegilops tauschii subsp. strangulata TaxID=200361 RepID=A0A453MIX9_AEGTS